MASSDGQVDRVKRGGPLRRKSPLRQRSPLRADGAQRSRPNPTVDANWRKVRAEVAARTWCEAPTAACPPGRHRGAHAHHVVLRSQGGPDEAHNLLWVCHLAHDWIHAHPKLSYEQGWLRRSTDG